MCYMGSALEKDELEVASSESQIVVDSPSTRCPVSSETKEESQALWGGGVLLRLCPWGFWLFDLAGFHDCLVYEVSHPSF